MKRAKNLLCAAGALAVLPLMASACGSSGGSPSVTCTNGTVVANEMNDYQFSSAITLPTVKVKSMSDLTFDWGGVTTDFLGHTVNPVADLNTIFLLVVDLPIATFQKQLNDDTFSQARHRDHAAAFVRADRHDHRAACTATSRPEARRST